MRKISGDNQSFVGIIYAVIAFASWGVLPLYWKLLANIPAEEILASRIIFAFAIVFSILAYKKHLYKLKEILINKEKLFPTIFSAIMISINWFVYIWAVKSNKLIEVSLGYYINPLIVVLLGMLVLKERLSRIQLLSLFLAAIGVAVMTMSYGKMPWISLTLAFSFGIYGLAKKIIKTESIVSLGVETLIMLPIAVSFLFYKGLSSSQSIMAIKYSSALLLPFTGVATAGPLICFAEAAKRIPLSMLGFLQYIYPTLSLLIGIFIFKEEFTKAHLIGFAFIWLGLIIYSLSQFRVEKTTDS